MKKILIISAIFMLAFFLRSYRTADLMGFWYDQGRDAKIIWELWQSSKFFLIGPTTGIEGIFLGPFYYYFITPFYILGNGNPVIPSLWLSFVTSLTVVLIYKITKPFGFSTAIIAGFLYTFSSSIVQYNRWLSNPTPLPFFSLLAFYALIKIIDKKPQTKYPLILGLSVGLGLQLEAASATFFIPAVLLTLVIFYRSLKVSLKSAILGIGGFFVTLLPQILFNFRHDNILLNAFYRFLITESSFKPELVDIFTRRLKDYFGFFFGKLFVDDQTRLLFAVFLLLAVIILVKKYKSKVFAATFIWWFTPMVFLIFYHGNNGFVWDYYFTGAYPIFMLTIGIILGWCLRYNGFLKYLALVFLITFIFQNTNEHQRFLTQKSTGYISLTTINSAVDWVYKDAQGRKFNVDVYLPPVISHSYDYIFLWRGNKIHKHLPSTEIVPLLYTLAEPDGERPHYRKNWLDRQDTYGSVNQELQINQLLIQRRSRYSL